MIEIEPVYTTEASPPELAAMVTSKLLTAGCPRTWPSRSRWVAAARG